MPKQDQSNYHTILCRVSAFEKKKFKELEEQGITTRQVLEILCDRCNGMKLYAFDRKTGNQVELPSNLLSKRK